jgi:transposase-like protein
VELRIPKVRIGSFFPSLLDPYACGVTTARPES